MSIISEHTVELAGFSTRMQVCGAGDNACVFLPAVMDSPTSYGRLQLMLRRRFGDRVATVVAELPGYGGDDEVPGFDTWPAFCADLVSWVEGRFAGRFVFAGNSSGAVAATEAAVCSTRTAGLALLCWCDWRLTAPRSDALLCPTDASAAQRLHEMAWYSPPALPGDVSAQHANDAHRYRAHVASFDAVYYRASLAQVRAPLLIVAGDGDGLVPVADAQATANGHRRSELTVLARCGHYPHREQPSALADSLGTFVHRTLGLQHNTKQPVSEVSNATTDRAYSTGSTALHSS